MINKKVTVVIPAYNEEATIGDIIDECEPYCDEILISLAKNSKDRTATIAEQKGVKLIRDNGLGKGDGMRCAINTINDGIIVFIDADGSHDAKDIPKLAEPIKKNQSDMVIASRAQGGSVDAIKGHPFQNFFREVFTSAITLVFNLRFKTDIAETQNGFRAIRTDVAKRLKLTSEHTEVETEMGMKCLKKGFRISEIPSRELARRHGKSNISLWKHGPKYVWMIIKNLF